MAEKKTPPKKGSQEHLVAAVLAKDPDQVRQALAAGADPNRLAEGKRYSPLMIAIGPIGDDEAAAVLVEAGADPHEVDEDGFTMLHYASHLGRTRTCGALLRAGADPNAISRARSASFEGMTKGATPLKVADDAATKKLLAAVTTVGLTTGNFAKKLERLRGWSSLAADFEGGEPDIEGLAGFDAEGYLHPLGQTGNGSVFALWSRKKAKKPKDGAVVYMDSEGEPSGAIARSLDEFLSVLPHGTGWLYEAASGNAPAAKGALAEVAAQAQAEEGDDGKPVLGGQPFAKWWKKTFGVAAAKSPKKVVVTAMGDKPTLETWLRKKAK